MKLRSREHRVRTGTSSRRPGNLDITPVVYVVALILVAALLMTARAPTWPTTSGFSELDVIFEPGVGLDGKRVYLEIEADFFGGRTLVGTVGPDLRLHLEGVIPGSVTNEIKINSIGFDELVGVFFVKAERTEGEKSVPKPQLTGEGVVYVFALGGRPLVWSNGAPSKVVLTSSLGTVARISALEIPEDGLVSQIPGVSICFSDKNFISIGGGWAIVSAHEEPWAKVRVESSLVRLEQEVIAPSGEDMAVAIATSVGRSIASRLRELGRILSQAGGTLDRSFEDSLTRFDAEVDKLASAMELGEYQAIYASSQAAMSQLNRAYETLRASFLYLVPWALTILFCSAAASVSLPMLLIEDNKRQTLAIALILPLSLGALIALHPVVVAVLSNLALFVGSVNPEMAISLVQIVPFLLIAVFLAASGSVRQALWESFGLASRRARRTRLRTILLFLTVFTVAAGATVLLSLSPQYRAYTFRSPKALSHGLAGISFYEYELYEWRITPDPNEPNLPVPHYIPLSDRLASAVREWAGEAAIYSYYVGSGLIETRPSFIDRQGEARTMWLPIVYLDPPDSQHELAWPRSIPWESLRQGAVLIPRSLGVRGWYTITINGKAARGIDVFENEVAFREAGPDGEDFFVGLSDAQFVIVNRAEFEELRAELLRIDAIFPREGFEGIVNDLSAFAMNNAITEVGRRYDTVRTPVGRAYSDGSVTVVHSGAMVAVPTGPWAQATIPVTIALLIVASQIYGSLLHRRSEISTMSAMGSSPLRLFLTSMAEPFMIGIVGGMTGYYVGIMISSIQAESTGIGLGSFAASLIVSLFSTVVGGYMGSTRGILRVVPSGRLSSEATSIVRKIGDEVLVDVPLRVGPMQLGSFKDHLTSLQHTAPAQKYLYDGLRVVSVHSESPDVHHIAVFYGAERSAYLSFRIEAKREADLAVSVTPLKDDSLVRDEWRPHHQLLLERAAHDLRMELLRFAERRP